MKPPLLLQLQGKLLVLDSSGSVLQTFADTEDPHDALQRWLATHRVKLVSVCVDRPDEQYHQQRLSGLTRRDYPLMARKIERRHFQDGQPATVCFYPQPEGDIRALAVGVDDSAEAWLTTISSIGVLVHSVSTVPLYLSQLFTRRRYRRVCNVVICPSGNGLRMCLFRGAELLISRFSYIGDELIGQLSDTLTYAVREQYLDESDTTVNLTVCGQSQVTLHLNHAPHGVVFIRNSAEVPERNSMPLQDPIALYKTLANIRLPATLNLRTTHTETLRTLQIRLRAMLAIIALGLTTTSSAIALSIINGHQMMLKYDYRRLGGELVELCPNLQPDCNSPSLSVSPEINLNQLAQTINQIVDGGFSRAEQTLFAVAQVVSNHPMISLVHIATKSNRQSTVISHVSMRGMVVSDSPDLPVMIDAYQSFKRALEDIDHWRVVELDSPFGQGESHLSASVSGVDNLLLENRFSLRLETAKQQGAR